MTTAAVPTSTSPSATQETAAKGHVGLVVLASIAAGLALGLAARPRRLRGRGRAADHRQRARRPRRRLRLLALASTRFTNQPQRWALVPGVASIARRGRRRARARSARFSTSPAGSGRCCSPRWSSPPSAARGARSTTGRAARSSTRRSSCCSSIAVGGAVGTVMAATSSNPAPRAAAPTSSTATVSTSTASARAPRPSSSSTGSANGRRAGRGCRRTCRQTTRVCAFDRAGEGWSGGKATAQDGPQLASDLHALLARRACPGAVCPRRALGRRHLRARLRRAVPEPVAGVALIDSATPYQFDLPDYPGFYSMLKRASALLPISRTHGDGPDDAAERVRLPAADGSRRRPRFNSSPRAADAPTGSSSCSCRRSSTRRSTAQPHGKPLAVLSASVGEMRGWPAAQNKLARLSTNSTHRTVAGATHAALLEDKRLRDDHEPERSRRSFSGPGRAADAHVLSPAEPSETRGSQDRGSLCLSKAGACVQTPDPFVRSSQRSCRERARLGGNGSRQALRRAGMSCRRPA